MKRIYSTDLSDTEWEYLEPHVPPPNNRGRPRVHTTRQILDAIFYVLKSGCPWRLLPCDFPPWATVYCWFRRWRIDGTWESDGGKKIRGRKRHLLVDTEGLVLKAKVHSAKIPDQDGLRLLLDFSWLSQNRRMSKDYEKLTATAEAFIYAAMTRLMVRRLARA